jgi:hypothetical protein
LIDFIVGDGPSNRWVDFQKYFNLISYFQIRSDLPKLSLTQWDGSARGVLQFILCLFPVWLVQSCSKFKSCLHTETKHSRSIAIRRYGANESNYSNGNEFWIICEFLKGLSLYWISRTMKAMSQSERELSRRRRTKRYLRRNRTISNDYFCTKARMCPKDL